jgi:hypothetical protein
MTLTEVVGVVGTTVATMMALYGLDAWRREHPGRRRIELAEETLALFYEAVDAIQRTRNPFSMRHEQPQLMRDEFESDAEYHARQRAAIVTNRLEEHDALFARLHAMRYRFMAQVGKVEAQPFDDIRTVATDIRLAAYMLTRLWPRHTFEDPASFEEHRAKIEKFEAVFGWGDEETDPIPPRMATIIEAIEQTCGRIIAGKGTLFGSLNIRLHGSSR